MNTQKQEHPENEPNWKRSKNKELRTATLISNKGKPVVFQNRLGRNDICHCGSGKKYKNCHLDLDNLKYLAIK